MAGTACKPVCSCVVFLLLWRVTVHYVMLQVLELSVGPTDDSCESGMAGARLVAPCASAFCYSTTTMCFTCRRHLRALLRNTTLTALGLNYTIFLVCTLLPCLPRSPFVVASCAQTQEAPSFLVPAGLVAAELAHPTHGRAPALALSPSTALLGCFMAHYLHRAFVYPLAVQRGGKPTPAPVWLMALAFCTYNGLMQVQAHAACTKSVFLCFSWTRQREAQIFLGPEGYLGWVYQEQDVLCRRRYFAATRAMAALPRCYRHGLFNLYWHSLLQCCAFSPNPKS